MNSRGYVVALRREGGLNGAELDSMVESTRKWARKHFVYKMA